MYSGKQLIHVVVGKPGPLLSEFQTLTFLGFGRTMTNPNTKWATQPSAQNSHVCSILGYEHLQFYGIYFLHSYYYILHFSSYPENSFRSANLCQMLGVIVVVQDTIAQFYTLKIHWAIGNIFGQSSGCIVS